MAKTNYQIFNEENAPERTYNDSEYKEATQRVGGVMPGMALSRMHNKMYYQWSAMCKAIANLIVSHGHDCMDNDVEGITRYLEETIVGAATTEITTHRTAAELDHPEKSVHKKHLHSDAYESPALTGTPTAPTAGKGTNNGQIASTAFVAQAIAALIDSAPGALDTLQELASALGNDANFSTTVTNALAGKVSKSGDTMTGPLNVPILDVRSGFFGDYKRDSGDAIDGNGGANVNVGSWYGIGFYDMYNKKYTGSMNLRTGDWRTLGKIRADQGFVGDLAGTADNANKLGGQSLQWIINQINVAKTSIAILTGVLNDGGTIPLPDGYTESQCRWMVSPKSDNYNLSTWDIDESGGQKLIYTFYCHTEGRKVVCRSRHVGDDGDRTFLGSVNYMIIGVK